MQKIKINAYACLVAKLSLPEVLIFVNDRPVKVLHYFYQAIGKLFSEKSDYTEILAYIYIIIYFTILSFPRPFCRLLLGDRMRYNAQSSFDLRPQRLRR
jgi:hypothetical protein